MFLQLGSAWLKMENLENKVDVLRGYGGFQEYVSLQKMSDLAKAWNRSHVLFLLQKYQTLSI